MSRDAAPATTTRLPTDHCPKCGKTLDAATIFADRARPSPGDFTVCIRCFAALEFGPDLKLLLPDRVPEDVERQIAGMVAALRSIPGSDEAAPPKQTTGQTPERAGLKRPDLKRPGLLLDEDSLGLEPDLKRLGFDVALWTKEDTLRDLLEDRLPGRVFVTGHSEGFFETFMAIKGYSVLDTSKARLKLAAGALAEAVADACAWFGPGRGHPVLIVLDREGRASVRADPRPLARATHPGFD